MLKVFAKSVSQQELTVRVPPDITNIHFFYQQDILQKDIQKQNDKYGNLL